MIRKASLIYNLLLTLGLTIFAFTQISTAPLLPLLFLPLPLYFIRLLRQKPITLHNRLVEPEESVLSLTQSTFSTLSAPKVSKKKKAIAHSDEALVPEVLNTSQVRDIDRRLFLKLIGSAGLTTFLFSLFTNKSHAAFFGSIPGPGTVALKDSSGNQIDPAQHHPTSLYKISQVDDSSPAYYGFVDKTGAWYIQKEDSSGNYRYVKGTSAFSTNWTNRASLTYDYFDNIF